MATTKSFLILIFMILATTSSTFATEEMVTVLSIDGGAIRGIIPGVILRYLEAELQVS